MAFSAPGDVVPSTMNGAAVEQAAASLEAAERSRTPVRQISLQNPGMTISDAYAVQRAWIDLKIAGGHSIKGYKIGLTSHVMQTAVNVREPDSGVLLDDMFYNDGDAIPTSRFIAPRLEAEIAFVLRTSLAGPSCTVFDVLNATDFVIPALEILDARMHRVDPETKKTRTVLDTISDNAANAALVIGGRPVRPADMDLRWESAICYRNGRIEETGVAAAVLGNPAMGVAWLANRLALHGGALEAGHIVLSGSFIRPIDISCGDVIHAEYNSLGSISCRFT